MIYICFLISFHLVNSGNISSEDVRVQHRWKNRKVGDWLKGGMKKRRWQRYGNEMGNTLSLSKSFEVFQTQTVTHRPDQLEIMGMNPNLNDFLI